MPNTGVTTLITIITQAAQRVDMPTPSTTTFVTKAEWTTYINASYQELYGLLVQKFGDDYYFAGTPDLWYQFTTDGTNASYSLPDGSSSYKLKDNSTTAPAFFKLLGVDLQLNSAADGWLTIKPFTMIERNRLGRLGTQAIYGWRTNLKYRIVGSTIWLTPLPQSGQILRLWYTPRLTLLSGDSDTADMIDGWEEYIVIDAAIKARVKEETDTTDLMVAKAAIVARIESEADNRDAGSPMRVSDSRRVLDGYSGDDFSDEPY